MFSKYVSPLFVVGLFFFLSGCDETVSPSNNFEAIPSVERLTVIPNDVSFVPEDGFKDTTFTIHIEASIINVTEETTYGFAIRDKVTKELVSTGELTAESRDNIFWNESDLETSTTSFEEYIVEVYAYNNDGNGNYFQTQLSVSGFSNNPPEILEVNNPEEVQRPSSGQTSVSFTAKTTDEDGQDTIDAVYLRLISRVSGEVSGSPFQLYDDGSTQSDTAPNDSIYTATFPVSPANQLQTYDILYYAIDKGGLVSDTVKTTFSIIE